jgi:hypothetical protein
MPLFYAVVTDGYMAHSSGIGICVIRIGRPVSLYASIEAMDRGLPMGITASGPWADLLVQLVQCTRTIYKQGKFRQGNNLSRQALFWEIILSSEAEAVLLRVMRF